MERRKPKKLGAVPNLTAPPGPNSARVLACLARVLLQRPFPGPYLGTEATLLTTDFPAPGCW